MKKACLGPCFSGCLVGTIFNLKEAKHGQYVSVLVIVDVWWVPSEGASPDLYNRCLGPCFSGCLVGTCWVLCPCSVG